MDNKKEKRNKNMTAKDMIKYRECEDKAADYLNMLVNKTGQIYFNPFIELKKLTEKYYNNYEIYVKRNK